MFAGITALTKAHDISTALILGTPDSRCIEALLDGMASRPGVRRVFCVGPPTRELRRLERAFAGRVTCVEHEGTAAPRHAGTDLVSTVDRAVGDLEHEYGIHRWDAVLVDGGMFTPESNAAAAVRAIAGAQLIVLTGLDIAYMFARSQELLQDAVHVLAAFDPGHRSGYAIFAMRGADAGAPAAHVSGAVLQEGGVAASHARKQG